MIYIIIWQNHYDSAFFSFSKAKCIILEPLVEAPCYPAPDNDINHIFLRYLRFPFIKSFIFADTYSSTLFQEKKLIRSTK